MAQKENATEKDGKNKGTSQSSNSWMDLGAATEELKKNMPELTAGIFILIIVMLMLVIKSQFIISVIASTSILLVALESRAHAFDRMFSIIVIFLLCVGFVLFG